MLEESAVIELLRDMELKYLSDSGYLSEFLSGKLNAQVDVDVKEVRTNASINYVISVKELKPVLSACCQIAIPV